MVVAEVVVGVEERHLARLLHRAARGRRRGAASGVEGRLELVHRDADVAVVDVACAPHPQVGAGFGVLFAEQGA